MTATDALLLPPMPPSLRLLLALCGGTNGLPVLTGMLALLLDIVL